MTGLAATLVLEAAYADRDTGLRHEYYRQVIDGRSVALAHAARHWLPDGRLLAETGAGLVSPELCAPDGAPGEMWFLRDGRLVGASERITGEPPRLEWIDAATGELLARHELAFHAATEGCTYLENPTSPKVTMAWPDRDVLRVPASPLGWASGDETAGNNVLAQEDQAGDDEATILPRPRAAAGPPLSFCFSDPLEEAINQVFYFVNFAHDLTWEWGFDEPAGNCQMDNFGRGGTAGDPIRADVWESRSRGNRNNAYAYAYPDGREARLAVNASGTGRGELALDGDVVLHEFTHILESRLVGGPARTVVFLGLQAATSSEAMADFFPALVFGDPCLFEWFVGTPARCIDVLHTYGELCRINVNGCAVHDDSRILSSALWDLRGRLVASFGAGARDRLGKLWIDALKMVRVSPSFLDLRDALLLADQARYQGEDLCDIWKAFARSGMGFSASTIGTDDRFPVEAFDLPPGCVSAGELVLDRAEYGCGGTLGLGVIDGDNPASVSVLVVTDGGDAETLLLACDPVQHSCPGRLPLVEVATPASVVPGNGTLEVIEGEAIRASYTDAAPARTVVATAPVRCVARIELLGHRIEGGCDPDTVAGYPELSGFLDAGEQADVVLVIASAESHDLADAVLALVSESATVSVDSPAVALGTLPASHNGARLRREARFRVRAAAGAAPGERATLRLELTATGIHALAARVALGLELARDYRLSPGEVLLSEDFESGSAFLWTHAATFGPDEWQLVTCDAASPVRSYRMGASVCAALHADQVSALFSPPLRGLGADAAAYRPSRLEYRERADTAPEGQFFHGLIGPGAPSYDSAYFADRVRGGNTASFEPVALDISPATFTPLDFTGDIRLFFEFFQGAGVPAGTGWYVDDVRLLGDVVRIVDDGQVCASPPFPLSLRGARQGRAIEWSWSLGGQPERTYNLHRTGDRLRLDRRPGGIGSEPVVAAPTLVERVVLAGEADLPGLLYYAVYERDASTGESRF